MFEARNLGGFDHSFVCNLDDLGDHPGTPKGFLYLLKVNIHPKLLAEIATKNKAIIHLGSRIIKKNDILPIITYIYTVKICKDYN